MDGVASRKRASDTPHGLYTSGWREHHISLLYRGAHGNGYEATRTNAWGEMTSTAVSVRVQGQVASLNQEPPWL
jgi:hypothetical protein